MGLKVKAFNKKNNILIGEGSEISNGIISFVFNNLNNDFIVCPFNLLEIKIYNKYKQKVNLKIYE